MKNSTEKNIADIRLRLIEQFTSANPPVPGNADVICFGASTIDVDAAAASVHLLSCFHADTQKPLYLRVHVFLGDNSGVADKIMEYAIMMLASVGGNADESIIRKHLSRRMCFIRMTCFEHNELLSILNTVPSGDACVVAHAARYMPSHPVSESRTASSHKTPFLESFQILEEEDNWTAMLSELANAAHEIASIRSTYIILLAGRYYPNAERNQVVLGKIKGNIFGERPVADVESQVARHKSRWHQLMILGQQDAVFAEISAIATSGLNHSLLKAQSLLHVGRGAEGFEFVKPYLAELLREGSPGTLVIVAQMALHAGGHADSLSFLNAAIAGDPLDEPVLRMIHQHARRMRAEPQAANTRQLLRRRFPRSTYVLCLDIDEHLSRHEYAQILEVLCAHGDREHLPDELRYAIIIATGLGAQTPWTYNDLISEVGIRVPSHRERAVFHCVRHALERDQIEEALELLGRGTWSDFGVRASAEMTIHAIKRWAMSVPPGGPQRETEQRKHRRALQAIISAIPATLLYLATHPEDGELRLELTNALSTERLGSLGYGALLLLLEGTEQAGFRETAEGDCADAADLEEFLDFFKRYFDLWDGRPLVCVPEPLPLELHGCNIGSIYVAAVQFVGDFVERIDRYTESKETLFMSIKVAIDLAGHLRFESEPFKIIGLAASAMANMNLFQDARDLAESALMMMGSNRSAKQHRAAWIAFSDVYARCRNRPEAILGWLCAMQIKDVELTPLEAGQELLLYARLLRDVYAYDKAVAQIEKARAIFTRSHAATLMHHRVLHLESMVRMFRSTNEIESRTETSRVDALPELAEIVASSLVAALESEDDPHPSAVSAAQVIAMYREHYLAVPDALLKSFERALELVGPAANSRLRILASERPSQSDLLIFARELAETRYTSDLATDLWFSQVVARRALSGAVEHGDVSCAILAVELLAIHALRPGGAVRSSADKLTDATLEELRGWASKRVLETTVTQERVTLSHLILRIDGPEGPRDDTTLGRLSKHPELLEEVVELLGRNAVDVHALALSYRDRLVRISYRLGIWHAPIEEQVSTFSESMLHQWRMIHPYAYGAPGDDASERESISYVEKSMAGIGTTATSIGGTCLYILDNHVADLPTNLLLANGQFAGFAGPVASAPSLTWLHTVLRSPRERTGRRIAWFLPSSEEEALPPLLILRSALERELESANFSVIADKDLPSSCRGADLAIVGAHGSVWSDNGLFRAISDEKNTRYLMSDFSAHLAGTAVVILLVCSGGRLDRAPLSLGATGLPYELLHRGCRAVVGSPWPLDVLVARRWALCFVEAWDAGLTVAESVHLANHDLRLWMPDKSHSLAMHVIGNPLECASGVHRAV
ncbi:hypothetical protein WMF04_00935 [Sorangium sp. So ce260]|uniref:hypothetical protein n=1 Tax=Sorangium sp. So ce260 TaxID=3133291 RepID=UPI003F6219F0